MARCAVIELGDKFGEGGVQRRQRQEAPIAQLGDDEARRHLDGELAADRPALIR